MWKNTDADEGWSKLAGFPVDTTSNENGVSFVVLEPNGSNAADTLYAGVSQSNTTSTYLTMVVPASLS